MILVEISGLSLDKITIGHTEIINYGFIVMVVGQERNPLYLLVPLAHHFQGLNLVEDHSDERRLMKNILVVVCVLFSVVIGLSIAWSGEKEDLSWKARAIVAEFKDASNKLNDANEVFTKTKEELTKFAQELDAKGLSLQMDGKIVDKPKPQPPEKKVEPPKK